MFTQSGNGGSAMKSGKHKSQKNAGGGASSSDQPPALPNDVTDEMFGSQGSESFYSFSEGNNYIYLEVDDIGSSHDVNFAVNGSFHSVSLPTETGSKIARKIKNIMLYDAYERPDGFLYSAKAATADSLGASRAALYARAGFSLSSEGSRQYAVVKDGKLVPATSNGRAYDATQLSKHNRDVREAIREGAKIRRAARKAADSGAA